MPFCFFNSISQEIDYQQYSCLHTRSTCSTNAWVQPATVVILQHFTPVGWETSPVSRPPDQPGAISPGPYLIAVDWKRAREKSLTGPLCGLGDSGLTLLGLRPKLLDLRLREFVLQICRRTGVCLPYCNHPPLTTPDTTGTTTTDSTYSLTPEAKPW